MPKDQFLATPEEDLVCHLVESLYVDLIELHEDAKFMTHGETQVDVSPDHDRFFSPRDDRGPFYIPGIEVTVHIPTVRSFTGQLTRDIHDLRG